MNSALTALAIALFAQSPGVAAPPPAPAPTGEGSALPEAAPATPEAAPPSVGPVAPTSEPQDNPRREPEPAATDPGRLSFIRAFVGGGYSGYFVGCYNYDGPGGCFRGDRLIGEGHGELRLNFGRRIPLVLALTAGYGGVQFEGDGRPVKLLDLTADLGIGYAFALGAFEVVVYVGAGYRQEIRLFQGAIDPKGFGAFDSLLGASASFQFSEWLGVYVDLSWRFGSNAGDSYSEPTVAGVGPRLSLGLTLGGER